MRNIFYFLAHLIVDDGKIDERQLLFLRDLLTQLDLTELEKAEIEKILANDDDKKPLEQVLHNLKGKVQRPWQEISLEVGAIIAVCTNSYFEDEQSFLHQARKSWGISKKRFDELMKDVHELISKSHSKKLKTYSGNLVNTPFLKITNVITKWSPEKIKAMMEKLNEKILLSGPEYRKAIAFCKEIAKEDFHYAYPILEQHRQILMELSSYTNGILQDMEEGKNDEFDVKGAIAGLEQQIKQLVDEQLKEVDESLTKKERAMNHFTISFMGKTKAGKSTLHAVITGRGKKAIGAGKQRTTRLNRVYTWNQIRIIDTPGIGAPGGQSDEEIAKSIIDESDLICYVVKNDSVQPAEFAFLKRIKEKNKPIIILLNVKENLEQPARLKRYLDNPEWIYERKDAKSLDGHINRIRRYTEEHYQNSTFDIIPVQLYAALLSKDDSFSKSDQDRLYAGSHIEQFLNAIRLSIIEDGHIRRSQTILDGLIYPVHKSNSIFSGNVDVFQTIAAKLKGVKSGNHKKLKDIRDSYEKQIGIAVDQEFAKLEDKISSFATNNYHRSKGNLEQEWGRLVQSIGLEQSLQARFETVLSRYAADIEQHLKEMVEDLSFSGQRISRSIDVKLPNLFDAKRLFGYLAGFGSILMVGAPLLAKTALAALTGPIGWVGAGIVAVGTILSFLFKSKKKKIKEAIDKLTTALERNVQKQKQEIKASTLSQFNKAHQDLAGNIEVYQTTLISSLEKIVGVLSSTLEMIRQQESKLNKAYAYRLLQAHVPRNEYPKELDESEINELVTEVDRQFGKSFVIQTPKALEGKIQDAFSHKIQEQVIIKTIRERVGTH